MTEPSSDRWTPGPRPDDWRERWDLWRLPGQTPERIFGDAVRRAREAQGLTRAELSAQVWERTGVAIHPTAVGKFEGGADRRHIRLDEAAALALVLDLDLDAIASPRRNVVIDSDALARQRSEVAELLVEAEERVAARKALLARDTQHANGLRRRLSDLTALTEWAGTAESGGREEAP